MEIHSAKQKKKLTQTQRETKFSDKQANILLAKSIIKN